MFKNWKNTFVILAISVILPKNIYSQEDGNGAKTHSPYSMYGIGDIAQQGGVRNRAMGGLIYATRDNLSINSYNPAALSIQDSLVVMLDFALGSNNLYSKTNNTKTSANSFYFDYVDLSMRIAKGLTFDIGLSQVSDVGYDIERHETDPELIFLAGDIKYKYVGEGGINQLHWGAGYKLTKFLSIGANFHYYFGSINKNYSTEFPTNKSFYNIYSSYKTRISKVGLTFGVQLHTQINENTLFNLGAIYRPKTNLPVRTEALTTFSGDFSADTVIFKKTHPQNYFMPQTFGVGFTIKKNNKLTFGIDYTYQNWTGLNSGTTKSSETFSFVAGKSHAYNVGMEYIPRDSYIKNGPKRWSYRAGFRYIKTFMTCNNQEINEYSISLGLGIPVTKRFGSKINAAIEFGQRGTLSKGLIKENFVTISLGFNIFDIWFQKFQFD